MYPSMQEAHRDRSDRYRLRRHERHRISILTDVTFPTRGIRGIQTAALETRDIGQGGCAIYIGSLSTIPDHFYLEPKGIHPRLSVACHVVGRTDDTIHVKFNRDLTREQLDEIIAAHFERA